jgi:manganese transport protein
MVRQERIDLLVAGGHGHRRVGDLLRGETINGVRHRLNIPVLAVRGKVADGKEGLATDGDR